MPGEKFKIIENGSITSPQGFLAGSTYAGIKQGNKLDLGILYSEKLCNACGVFTTNQIKSAPVLVSQNNLKNHKAQAIVVNSGCANACTGRRGLLDARKTASLVAQKLSIDSENVLVGSTGVIGAYLPMKRISGGIKNLSLTKSGGMDFAKCIMTTDTFNKEIALQIRDGGGKFILAGVAKGAGMIHPDMATMFCFITTDALIHTDFMGYALKKAIGLSFNMITVDGDTSPSDTVTIMANGLANNKPISKNNGAAFQEGLNYICTYLAKCIARDGEGATKLIEVIVENAKTISDAEIMARTIACSPLVKTAVHGNDPNWGRIVAAAGRSGARILLNRLNLYLNKTCVMRTGEPGKFNAEKLSMSMQDSKEILIRLDLALGKGKATAWGCDLSEEYVTINSAYTT